MNKTEVQVYCIRSMNQYRIIFDSTPRVGEAEVAGTKINIDNFIKYSLEKGWQPNEETTESLRLLQST